MDARDLNWRLAGEVEARNVERRMHMTEEERRATPPWLTQDVPDEDQIIVLPTKNKQELEQQIALAMAKARDAAEPE
jgi:hypothetical protein